MATKRSTKVTKARNGHNGNGHSNGKKAAVSAAKPIVPTMDTPAMFGGRSADEVLRQLMT